MTSNAVSCAVLQLRDRFGDVVADVAGCLLRKRSESLRFVARHTQLPISKVGEALRVLVQHHMVVFSANPRSPCVEYSVDVQQVLLSVRNARYIACAETLFGEAGKLVIRELLLQGQMTLSDVVECVTAMANEAIDGNVCTPGFIHGKFVSLAKAGFVMRCPSVVRPMAHEIKKQEEGEEEGKVQNPKVPTLHLTPEDKYRIPEVRLDVLGGNKDTSTGSKEKQPDAAIYWRVHHDRFHEYFRDQLLVSAVQNRFGESCASVVKCMCRLAETTPSGGWASTTCPLPQMDIEKGLQECNEAVKDVEGYLKFLSMASVGFVQKVEDLGGGRGGMYVVDRKKAIVELTWATVEQVVQRRFGSKCLRIFRLLRLNPYLEQKQIEEMAMMSSKDAKELTYKMVFENFVFVKELSKTPDYTPSRTFYLFYVDLLQVSHMVLDWSYKAMANMTLRRQMEYKENKRLLGKQQRVDAILASIVEQGADETQKAEVLELITPLERAELEKSERVTSTLELAELRMDETVFSLQLHLTYANMKD